MHSCPLCLHNETDQFVIDRRDHQSLKLKRNYSIKTYFHCRKCDLIFADPAERLETPTEIERYKQHQYDDTPDYRLFYKKLFSAIDANLKSPILDFGSGPNSLVAEICREKNHQVFCYDPLLLPDSKVHLNKTYPLIISTEAFEHFYNPIQELEIIFNSLEPGGTLAVMTSFHTGLETFPNWHYRRDPTHVSFYSPKTFEWIANFFSMSLLESDSPVCLLGKP